MLHQPCRILFGLAVANREPVDENRDRFGPRCPRPLKPYTAPDNFGVRWLALLLLQDGGRVIHPGLDAEKELLPSKIGVGSLASESLSGQNST
jgi:hypothetical protein